MRQMIILKIVQVRMTDINTFADVSTPALNLSIAFKAK